MLLLARRESEVICIGDDIRITVVRIKGSQSVRLGIEAPPGCPVNRAETIGTPAERTGAPRRGEQED